MSWGTRPKTDLVEFLAEAFVHRVDVYALQRETGAYYPVHDFLTDELLQSHLDGELTLGTYQLSQDNTVSWVCFDLDTEDPAAREHLVQCSEDFVGYSLAPEEREFGCLLLEDSNGKGRTHVWLLLSDPLPAAQVRAWVAKDFMPLWHTSGAFINSVTPEMWPLEVFPKQGALEPGGLGNLVRLPLGVNRKNGLRSEILGQTGWGTVDSYWRLPSGLVPVYGSPRLLPVSGDSRVRGDSATARLLRGEVYEGERNNTFASAAWHLRQEGIDLDLACEQLARWNEKLPDPLPFPEIEACVRGAYRKKSAVEPNEHRRPESGRKRPRWTPR